MSEQDKKTQLGTAGTSITTVVQIVFLIFKLCKVKPISNWQWWIVMLPIEINAGFCTLACCCGGCIGLALYKGKNEDMIENPIISD